MVENSVGSEVQTKEARRAKRQETAPRRRGLAEDRIEQRAERRQKRYGRGPLPFRLELRGLACVLAPEPCGALAATEQATRQSTAHSFAKSGMGTPTRSLGIMCLI